MVCFVAGNARPDDPAVFLTTNPEERIPVSEFDCRDKIYVYAVFRTLAPGAHKAEAFWYNSKGKFQQVSSHKFKTDGKPYAAWLWLKLHPSRGGGILGDIDPLFGMEEFIGRWTVRVYLNGELLSANSFYVAC